MGDSAARRWQWLGYLHFIRNRGRDTLDTIQPWVKIAVLGAPAAHYLGLSAFWSVAVGVGIVVGSEIAMLTLGLFDHRNGVMQRQQTLNNEIDTVKMEQLDLLRKILGELQAIRSA